ncbi:sugar ABC transporter substrate-binding protein [Streptomyces sp. NPDC058001]|uniref:sugar ABC transporter substrate-binding protein n=1 Tax=Streptomyces sp. NPDC058001 TaxID=3346300 RepID=UPI0036E87F7B
MRTSRTKMIGIAMAGVALAALPACSTSKPEANTVAAGDPSASTAKGADTAALDALYKGMENEPPSVSAKPAKGKSVWWISCGLSIPDCSVPANAAKEAAGKLGIDFHIADGKLNVGGGNASAVRTALAAKPDAIIIHGISCPIVQQPLEEAKAKGVKVLGVEALDCADTGGPRLFTTDMKYSKAAQSGEDYFKAWGKISAQYIIAKSGGKAKIINNEGTEPLQATINQGFLDEIKTCGGCTIVDTIKFSSADLTPNGPWIQGFRSSLVRNPTATATFLPFDVNIATAGGAQAVKESGHKLIAVGGTGQAPAINQVRSGAITAITGAHSPEWMGYAAIDQINRALNNEPTVAQGVGARVVDADHNMPPNADDYYQSPIDFRAAYDKAWKAATG